MNATTILRRIDDYVAQHHLIHPQDTIVIGLSGGPDSVFLLHYLVSLREKMKLNLIAAHLNHGWRPEANSDQQWCQSLCEQLQVTFVSKHAQEIHLDKKANGSKEELGRLLRHTFFTEVADQYHAQFIALGHHRNDSIETFFLNLIRGSTLSGLQGIKPKQGIFIRPLLCVTKTEILDYLKEHNLQYVYDTSNEQLDFLRNRIRHQIIPAFDATDDRYENKIVKTMEHYAEVDQFLTTLTQETFDKIKRDNSLDLATFNTLSPFLQKRVLLAWFKEQNVPIVYSSAWLNEILRFIETSKKSSHSIVENWQLLKHKNILILKRA